MSRLSTVGAGSPSVAKAHRIAPSSCGLIPPVYSCTDLARAPHSALLMWPAVANDQAALARFDPVKSLVRRTASLDSTANSSAFDLVVDAKAHAALTSSCDANSKARCFDELASTAKRSSSDRLAIANAHDRLARFCIVKLPRRCRNSFAKHRNSSALDWPAVAKAQEALARFYGLNWLVICGLASAENSRSSHWPTQANAHEKLATALPSPPIVQTALGPTESQSQRPTPHLRSAAATNRPNIASPCTPVLRTASCPTAPSLRTLMPCC
eukprot:gnl/TRDRNA2_/TRDRNA2_88819_c0_seq2.p1 gnl/TRDRNA2_/TRDRNA2_88819_c0~~gnl/TRDRNA2_/TRDRNA2_88819_c0_seq2.p1  ORF type:complete len:270 (-),score=24.00 gnl/TRDRNA2_/TRDRNA2_88819_c0_seq2:140-949(-)